ncbi:MAG TPA: hypothetical protein ENN11_04385 [Methanomicrobia archaeon]|nr:MAG: hypothetical protein EF808_04900 [archaeon]HHN81839.1 hypothetical protein [Methanomicrobia archaeon]
MNKAVWVLIGIVLIVVGVFLAVPYGGIDWSQELIDFIKGGLIIVLIMAGAFAFVMAKLE